MNKTLLTAALAGILSATAATSAMAADDHAGKEKCYGIAKAGKNDCASAKGTHACAGKSTSDNDGSDWKFVNKGDCVKEKGSLTPAEAK